MVLIKHFRSTSLWKAFVLNAICTTLTIYIAVTVNNYLDKIDKNNDDKNNDKYTTILNTILTLLITFCTALLSYYIMYITFGYGGGMLSSVT
jgi:hypothetical protein